MGLLLLKTVKNRDPIPARERVCTLVWKIYTLLNFFKLSLDALQVAESCWSNFENFNKICTLENTFSCFFFN